jgi:hypothetical protein
MMDSGPIGDRGQKNQTDSLPLVGGGGVFQDCPHHGHGKGDLRIHGKCCKFHWWLRCLCFHCPAPLWVRPRLGLIICNLSIVQCPLTLSSSYIIKKSEFCIDQLLFGYENHQIILAGTCMFGHDCTNGVSRLQEDGNAERQNNVHSLIQVGISWSLLQGLKSFYLNGKKPSQTVVEFGNHHSPRTFQSENISIFHEVQL